MYHTDVLIIGSGIAAFAVALPLARQGVKVTFLAPAEGFALLSEEEEALASLGEGDTVEALVRDVLQAGEGASSSQAVEQLAALGLKIVEETVKGELKVELDRNAEGSPILAQLPGHSAPRLLTYNQGLASSMAEAFQRKLQEFPNVEIIHDHSVVELMTLSRHSCRPADLYKKPTCVGAYLLDHASNEVIPYLAKETVLATSGSEMLYLPVDVSLRGIDGIALAHEAGARCVGISRVPFHPFGFCHPSLRPVTLPLSLCFPEAQVLSPQGSPLVVSESDQKDGRQEMERLTRTLQREMSLQEVDHLWLDLRGAPASRLQEAMPKLDALFHAKGFDMAKDPLPIVPVPLLSLGGVAVDRVGLTSVQRLRAVGDVACTGVHGARRLSGVTLLEALTWGKACGDDIAKQVNRFAYYFPEFSPFETDRQGRSVDEILVRQDLSSVGRILWEYAGTMRDRQRLARARSLLNSVQSSVEEWGDPVVLTRDLVHLRHRLVSASLLIEELDRTF